MSNEVAERKNEKVKILDSVRAAATIAVFIFHTGYLYLDLPSWPKYSPINWVKLATDGGTIGVNAFFILSGFLLFYQLYKKNEPLTKERLLGYAKKRALRILPLYYFSLFFIVLVFRHDILYASDGLRSIFYNLIFTRGIKNGQGGGGTIPIDPVYWSLVVEVHFYILLPIFYYLFYKVKSKLLFLLPIMLGLAYRLFLVFGLHNPTNQLMRFTLADFDFFAFGMYGAYLYIHRPAWLKYLSYWYMQIITLVVYLLFIYNYNFDFKPTLSYVFAPLFFAPLVVLCLLSFLLNNKTWLSKIFTAKPIMYIAQISFSIYIWHAIVIGKTNGLPISVNAKFALNVIITLVASTITYYLIEAPFLRVKEKKVTASARPA